MAKLLRLPVSTEQGIKNLLDFLLQRKRVSSVITLMHPDESNDVVYCQLTDSNRMGESLSFYPIMPVNAGKMLAKMTLKGAATKPVAVVIRPCELRALVELTKRGQGSLENLLIISSTCGGVYPLKLATRTNLNDKLGEYREALRVGKILTDIRPNCQACSEFAPSTADITVNVFGNSEISEQCDISLNSERAEEMLVDFAGKVVDDESEAGYMEKLRHDRGLYKTKLTDEYNSLDMKDIFESCIGCQACREVCPACYCRLCHFNSPISIHEPQDYERELMKKGIVRIPIDILYYHLVRLFHISLSCVACGQCQDVCPVDIPLGIVALKITGEVQESFGYVPGKDIEESLPITTFKPEEFAGVVG